MRNTHQRLQLLKLMENDKTHPSARDLYLRLKKKLPSVSFATVYNNLSKMAESGEILCLDTGLREKRYDPCVKTHGHFLCLNCYKIFDFNLKTVRPKIKNFKVLSYSLQAKGLCPACALKKGGKNGNAKNNKTRR